MRRQSGFDTRFLMCLLLVALPFPPSAAAQVMIVGVVGRDSLPADTSADVLVTRWGEWGSQPVHVRMSLSANDELRSAGGPALVEVVCGELGTYAIDGEFRVRIRSEEPPCSIDLSSGQVFVMGDSSTAVEVGAVRMAAVRTLYSVTASRERGEPVRRLVVFEGEVAVAAPQWTRPRVVGPQQVLEAGREARVRDVAGSDVDPVARTLARLDLARAAPEARGSAVAFETLYASHRRVLEAPDDFTARLTLAGAQLDQDAASRSTLYHVHRSQVLTPPRGEDRVDAEALAAVAYLQLGQPAEAAATLGRMAEQYPGSWLEALTRQRLDTAAVQRLLRTTRASPRPGDASAVEVDPRAAAEVTRSARRWPGGAVEAAAAARLRVEVRAEPAAVPAGQAVRVLVTVRNVAGEQVRGIAVAIEASGGAFSGADGAAIEGITNERGQFLAQWSCRRCSGEHEIRARARVAGLGEAQGAATVRVDSP